MAKGTAKFKSIRQGGSGNQKIDFRIDGSGGDVEANAAYVPDPGYRNSWTHVAVVWDGTFSYPSCGGVYIDGSYGYELYAFSGTVKSDAAYDLAIGSVQTSTDDIRLFDRELTTDEIAHLATSRGVQGGLAGDNFSPFSNAKYINRNYQIPRFG